MRTFIFDYWFEGARYQCEVVADDSDQAKRKLHQMTAAEYAGEVHAKIPVPAGGVLARLFGRH